MLLAQPRWEVVGEASDGPEAIQTIGALTPDLVLLDIGLPSLNGIEVARRILANDPGARILFLTEHRSPDVAEAALETGAGGYLVKSDVGKELLPAMDAVAKGERFVSSTVKRSLDGPDREKGSKGSDGGRPTD